MLYTPTTFQAKRLPWPHGMAHSRYKLIGATESPGSLYAVRAVVLADLAAATVNPVAATAAMVC